MVCTWARRGAMETNQLSVLISELGEKSVPCANQALNFRAWDMLFPLRGKLAPTHMHTCMSLQVSVDKSLPLGSHFKLREISIPCSVKVSWMSCISESTYTLCLECLFGLLSLLAEITTPVCLAYFSNPDSTQCLGVEFRKHLSHLNIKIWYKNFVPLIY